MQSELHIQGIHNIVIQGVTESTLTLHVDGQLREVAGNQNSAAMAKNKRMDQIKDILSTYASCKSVKETARRLRVSRNTVRRYLRHAEQAGQAPLEGRSLGEGSISPLVLAKVTEGVAEGREAHLREEADRLLQELKGVGVTKHCCGAGTSPSAPRATATASSARYCARRLPAAT